MTQLVGPDLVSVVLVVHFEGNKLFECIFIILDQTSGSIKSYYNPIVIIDGEPPNDIQSIIWSVKRL